MIRSTPSVTPKWAVGNRPFGLGKAQALLEEIHENNFPLKKDFKHDGFDIQEHFARDLAITRSITRYMLAPINRVSQ